jgi:hypothetical protein
MHLPGQFASPVHRLPSSCGFERNRTELMTSPDSALARVVTGG